jgi:hypothetical protein
VSCPEEGCRRGVRVEPPEVQGRKGDVPAIAKQVNEASIGEELREQGKVIDVFRCLVSPADLAVLSCVRSLGCIDGLGEAR